MLKKTVYLCLAFSLPAFADDNTAQRLWQSTRQAVENQDRKALKEETFFQTGMEADTPDQKHTQQDKGEALFSAIGHNDWHTVRSLLDEYRRQPQHNPDIALFAEAALARSDGKLNEARKHYELLLQRQPDFIRGRLDLARLLFEDQLNKESAEEFAKIPADQVPEAVNDNIRLFQSALENRQKWQGSVSTGLIWSSNINEGSDGSECLHIEELGDIWEHCQNGESSEEAFGINYETAASRRFQINGHHGLNTRILAYGKIYRNHQKYNEHTLNLSAGYQFANAKRTVTLAPLWEWGSSGQHAQHRAYGARAEWNETRSRWSWNTEAEWKKQIYFNNDMKHNNHRLFSVFNTLSYGLRDDVVIFGGLDWQQRFSEEPTESYRQPAIRLGAAKQFADGFDASFYTLLRHRSYKQENEFLGKRRRDNEQIHTLSLGADRWKMAGIKPVLTLKHRRVNSNIKWLNSFKQNEIGISLMKHF